MGRSLELNWVQIKEWWRLFWDALLNRPEDLFWDMIQATIIR